MLYLEVLGAFANAGLPTNPPLPLSHGRAIFKPNKLSCINNPFTTPCINTSLPASCYPADIRCHGARPTLSTDLFPAKGVCSRSMRPPFFVEIRNCSQHDLCNFCIGCSIDRNMSV